MKRKSWLISAAGMFGIVTTVCTVAVLADDCAPAEATPAAGTNEWAELVKLLDGPKWNQFIEDTTRALKQRAEDEDSRQETAEAIDAGVKTLNEMLKRAVAVADALQHSTETPEFEAWKKRVQQDVQSAADSLKEIDTDGLVKMLDAVTQGVVEPLEIVAGQAEEHFGPEKTQDPPPSRMKADVHRSRSLF